MTSVSRCSFSFSALSATQDTFGTVSLPPEPAVDPDAHDIEEKDADEALVLEEEEEEGEEDEFDLCG